MFDDTRLIGEPRREIIVQTHLGTAVTNYVAPPITQQDVNCYYGAIRPQHPDWKARKNAVGAYNCAGMVWASRRTCLTEPSDWQTILVEDGYRLLATQDEAELGDVAVYRNQEDGEILHVARICKKDRLRGDSREVIGRPILKALSKWDQRTGEDIHRLKDVNLAGNTPFRLEIWTDRPSGTDPRIAHIQHLPFSST